MGSECSSVEVKHIDGLIIVRRGIPKEVVAGRADVVLGFDEHGRIVNIEIDFSDFYYVDRAGALKILEKARW